MLILHKNRYFFCYDIHDYFNQPPPFFSNKLFQVLSARLYFTDFTIVIAAGAGLTGSKVATRIGDVDEFEFKAIGDNHNQGVSFFA